MIRRALCRLAYLAFAIGLVIVAWGNAHCKKWHYTTGWVIVKMCDSWQR